MVAAIVLLLAATGVLFVKYRNTSASYAETKVAEQAARSYYSEAFNTIAEIQDSLNAISVGPEAVKLHSQTDRAEQRLTEPNRQEALETIALVNASIQRTRQRISRLESNLKSSGMKVAGLSRMITNLKQTVAEKEDQVAQLTTQVDALQTRVTGLETTVQQDQDSIFAKNQNIEDKRRELGTIYYIVGTKKDLTNSGVIVAKGGVLGLGKTVQLSGRFDESKFTSIDTDEQTIVTAPASKLDKVKVLSPQPTSSYELVMAGNQVEIHILDPKEFRKVKHLVIMTA
jgi:cell division protein FtsB